MTTDTKLADLPAKWRSEAAEYEHMHGKQTGYEIDYSDYARSATLDRVADELGAALSRQDTQPAQPDEVDFYVCTNCDAYYRDSPVSECDCAVGARDFRHVRMAPVTQPEQQGAGDYHIAMLRELLANEFADQDEEGATRFTSERSALNAAIRALAARQPVGQEVVDGLLASIAVGSDGEYVSIRRWARDAAVAALRQPAGQDNSAIRRAGSMLANCAYNLAQRNHLTDSERRSLDESRKAWDAAIRAAPPAQVDLEQFRVLADFAIAHAAHVYYADVVAVDRLKRAAKSLIDQQAGKGVANG